MPALTPFPPSRICPPHRCRSFRNRLHRGHRIHRRRLVPQHPIARRGRRRQASDRTCLLPRGLRSSRAHRRLPRAAPRRPLAQDAAPPLQGAILINPVDENSAAYAPAAPGTSGGAKKKPARGTSTAAVYQTIEFRRTAIPILLTCGLLTIAFGALKYISGPDSPVADLPGWLPIALFITGAVLLGLAIANMLSVKQHLDTIKK